MALRMSDLPEHVRGRIVAVSRRVASGDRGGVAALRENGRRRGGRRARESGAALERVIASAAIEQRAVVELQELPKCGARFVGRGKAHAMPICCDFAGCVVGSGRAIFFDAKHVGGGNAFDLANRKLLKEHQAAFLFAQAGAGAIAGLLVQFTDLTTKARRHEGTEALRGLTTVVNMQFRWLDGRHLGAGRARIGWDDPRWHVMGERVDFARLLAVYEPRRGDGTTN